LFASGTGKCSFVLVYNEFVLAWKHWKCGAMFVFGTLQENLKIQVIYLF